MKFRLLFTCLSLSAATPFALRAADPAPAPAPEHGKSEEKHTELGDKMEKANSAWRKLRKQITDSAQNASSLELVAAFRESLKGAATLSPEKAADIPEADRAKFQADFAAGMKKLAEGIDRLETALKANNNEEAGKVLKELGDLQRTSHKAFRRPPPEKKP